MIADLENDSERKKRYEKHRAAISLLRQTMESVLRGTYRCVDGEERLYLDAVRYIKINYVSSGQQEIVWVFNLLFYYLLEDRKVFLILEEPESHLYPDSQQSIGEILSLFRGEGNPVLITTHSPYMLGTFNYLLLAGQINSSKHDTLKKFLRKRYWLYPGDVSAYHVHGGQIHNALDNDDNLVLIDNSLIDGASKQINDISDMIIDLFDSDESIGVYDEY